jgi:hypothetical protein
MSYQIEILLVTKKDIFETKIERDLVELRLIFIEYLTNILQVFF